MKTLLRLEITSKQPENQLQIGLQPDIYEAKIDFDPADTSRIACALHNLINYLSQQIGAPMQLNRSTPEQPFEWTMPQTNSAQALREAQDAQKLGAGVWNG